MPDFEAELAGRLRAPIDDGEVDPADEIAMSVERRIRVRRRMVAVAAAAAAVAMIVAILFGVRIAEDALPMMQAGAAASIALRVPIAIFAAISTFAASTCALVVVRAVR